MTLLTISTTQQIIATELLSEYKPIMVIPFSVQHQDNTMCTHTNGWNETLVTNTNSLHKSLALENMPFDNNNNINYINTIVKHKILICSLRSENKGNLLAVKNPEQMPI